MTPASNGYKLLVLFIFCVDLIGLNWISCVDLPESGFAVFWILSISWSRQHTAQDRDILYKWTHRITGQIAGYSGQTLTVNYVNRTVVRSDWFNYCIFVLLYELLRSSQLIVINISIDK